MTWTELMTQTGLGTMLAYTLACLVTALIVWNWGSTHTPRHTRTDPACIHYHAPTTRLGVMLYDRARGVPCEACLTVSAVQSEGAL